MLTARIFGHSETAVIATRASVNYADTISKTGDNASDANKKVKELQNSIMGFDEINKLTEPTSAAVPSSPKNKNPGMPAYGDMFKTVKVPQWVDNIGGVTDQIERFISKWWDGLTDKQKWGAGKGAIAGVLIGGIIGGLIGGPIGAVIGVVLGGTIGTVIGAWWEGLTDKEKWSAGKGATAGLVIGGIIGGLIGGPIGVVVGATLGGVAGALIGKWWADLTVKQKWSAGIGAGAGAIIGGIIGGLIGGPVGAVIGATLGGVALGAINTWWTDFTTKHSWEAKGMSAGALVGVVIGTMVGGPLGAVVGGVLGGAAGFAVSKYWGTFQSKWNEFWGWYGRTVQKNWSDFGNQIREGWNNHVAVWFTWQKWQSLGQQAIDGITAPFRNIQWPSISLPHISLPHLSISYDSSGWGADALKWFGLPGTPSLSVDWYANGGLFTQPTLVAGMGEAGPEAALPLNDKVFSQIAQGIVRNGSSNGSNPDHTEQILDRMDRLEAAIRSMKFALYADDRTIAESSNRGNAMIARQYHKAT